MGFYAAPVNFNKVGQVLVYLSGAFSVWSAVVYFRAFLAMLARRGGGSGEQKA
ncbi:MAG TPA: CDP-diacylglycerol--glycerol-3-phosphate 3-phosphatidyltransferase, partial [Cystobacter sp.]